MGIVILLPAIKIFVLKGRDGNEPYALIKRIGLYLVIFSPINHCFFKVKYKKQF